MYKFVLNMCVLGFCKWYLIQKKKLQPILVSLKCRTSSFSIKILSHKRHSRIESIVGFGFQIIEHLRVENNVWDLKLFSPLTISLSNAKVLNRE